MQRYADPAGKNSSVNFVELWSDHVALHQFETACQHVFSHVEKAHAPHCPVASLVSAGNLTLASLGHARARVGHRGLAEADGTAQGIEEAGDSEMLGKFFLLHFRRG